MNNLVVKSQKNIYRKDDATKSILYNLCFHSARLFNCALYNISQHYEQTEKYLSYESNYHVCKNNYSYRVLMSDHAQQILKLVDRNYRSFFTLLKLKKQGLYLEQINPPKYKPKTGLGTAIIQGRSARIKNGKVLVGMTSIFKERYNITEKNIEFTLPKNLSHITKLRELRIIPKAKGQYFEVEFVYHDKVELLNVDLTKHLAIDLGIDNFAACVTSTGDTFLIEGRLLKSINQQYNKKYAELQSIKAQQGYKHTTKRQTRLSLRRNNQINNFFNQTVNYLFKYCRTNQIGSVIIGDFKEIKREGNLGKQNNQNFQSIPYGKFKQKLKSKLESYGIQVSFQEESYTSKTSFLDLEPIEKQEKYVGRRIKRGLFRTANKRLVNADCNGAANILRKYLASNHRLEELNFERVSKGFVTNPVRLKLQSYVYL